MAIGSMRFEHGGTRAAMNEQARLHLRGKRRSARFLGTLSDRTRFASLDATAEARFGRV